MLNPHYYIEKEKYEKFVNILMIFEKRCVKAPLFYSIHNKSLIMLSEMKIPFRESFNIFSLISNKPCFK